MRTLFLFHKTGTALFIRASRAWGLLVLLLSAPLLGLSQSLVTYPVNAIRANDNTNTTLAPTGVNPNIIASPIRLNFNPNYFDPATPNTFTSGPQSDQGFFAMYQFTNANAYDPNSTQYLEFTVVV